MTSLNGWHLSAVGIILLMSGILPQSSSAASDDADDGGKWLGPEPEESSGGGLPAFPVAQTAFEASASLNASLVVRVNNEYIRLGFNLTVSQDGAEETDVDADAGPNHNPPAADQPAPLVPCNDPRGCPDLLVDPERMTRGDVITRTYSSTSCAVQEGSTEPGQRRLFRFSFTTPNVGDGDLIVGKPADHPELFVFATCHQHYHFVEYADYRLWQIESYLEWQRIRSKYPNASSASILEANPQIMDGFVAGHKQGFCVIDIVRYFPAVGAKYRSCSTNQGISQGWADEYHYTLDGQWVDITDVESNWYVLEAEVDAENIFAESQDGNNAGAVLVFIEGEDAASDPSIPPLPGVPTGPLDPIDFIDDLIHLPL